LAASTKFTKQFAPRCGSVWVAAGYIFRYPKARADASPTSPRQQPDRRPILSAGASTSEVKAQTYSFETANRRHEREWRVWQKCEAAGCKILMPGFVSDATNLVEYPSL